MNKSVKQMNSKRENPVLKKLDAPIEVLIVDPITLPVARFLAHFKIHPLVITFLAFIFRILAAYFFAQNFSNLGALFALFGFLLDGVDGKIARIRQIDEELHGTLDFLFDQVAFAIMGMGILLSAISNNQDNVALILGAWLASYMILMSFTSTWHRLISQSSIGYKDGIGEDVLRLSLRSKSNNIFKSFLGIAFNTFISVRKELARFRMQPYLGAIESEVIIFMIAPVFHYQTLILSLGVILLLPDIFMTFILNIMKVTQKSR
ncbi:MAG: CDP-alcohol phosphatidyltransferase family protein [Candidatus Woykebacteria bacterium]